MTVLSKHRRRWGKWTFDATTLSLSMPKPGPRQGSLGINLEACTCSAAVLDRLCEVGRQEWTSSADVGDLLKAIDDLAGGLQRCMCADGVEKMAGRNWALECLLQCDDAVCA